MGVWLNPFQRPTLVLAYQRFGPLSETGTGIMYNRMYLRTVRRRRISIGHESNRTSFRDGDYFQKGDYFQRLNTSLRAAILVNTDSLRPFSDQYHYLTQNLPAVKFNQSRGWNLEAGLWRLGFGGWALEAGLWRPGSGGRVVEAA